MNTDMVYLIRQDNGPKEIRKTLNPGSEPEPTSMEQKGSPRFRRRHIAQTGVAERFTCQQIKTCRYFFAEILESNSLALASRASGEALIVTLPSKSQQFLEPGQLYHSVGQINHNSRQIEFPEDQNDSLIRY